ncbi:MAG: zinc-binding dehydrogenase, partial [Clostridia bacterium]|nr:zinc-binding dehydrogenase [Clostridia bacterium]
EDENALLLARKSGVYYTVKAGAQAEKEVTSITGGRMVHKVVYTSRSNASVDLAFKLASPFGRFAFAGFSYPALKAPINVALRKQLSCVCITSGYGNTETAINALANKAVDFSNYALTATDMKDIPANLDNMMLAFKDKRPVGNLLINMLG